MYLNWFRSAPLGLAVFGIRSKRTREGMSQVTEGACESKLLQGANTECVDSLWEIRRWEWEPKKQTGWRKIQPVRLMASSARAQRLRQEVAGRLANRAATSLNAVLLSALAMK